MEKSPKLFYYLKIKQFYCTVCSKLIVKSNLLQMDTYVHFIVIYPNRKLFSSFESFLWFWNFENRFKIEDFMIVWKKRWFLSNDIRTTTFYGAEYKRPNFELQYLFLKVIELELSYRHLGMTKILNFNLKKKLCKNVQKWLIVKYNPLHSCILSFTINIVQIV